MVHGGQRRAGLPVRAEPGRFFGDDGLLLKKFVFRVAPQEGLRQVEPVVRRIVAAPRPWVASPGGPADAATCSRW